MQRDWGNDLHLGVGKRKRNDEGSSLGEDANPDDGSCFPTLLPKHKIFLSHSGKQKWFVEKLCEDLEARHRFPFFDKRPSSLPKGERFAKLILEAAEQCEMAVVVVSEEYLASKWPMIELNTFVQALYGSNPRLKILPLFFGLSVSDLQCSARQGAWLKVWNEWARDDARIKPVEFEEALKVMRSFNGIKFSGDMDNLWSFEKDVVSSICSAISADVKWEDSHVQGRSAICEAIRVKIRMIEPSEEYGVCVFGYYGVGGIGKTTMCRTLCNELSEFSGKVCHIGLGGTKSVEQMLKEVLKKLTNTSEELLQRLDKGECRNILKKCSSWRQKSFLAIDNVWDDNESMEQAQMFLEDPAFYEGSVVMVTSRCRSTLVRLGIPESHYFEMPELGKVDARKLFLYHIAKGEEFDNEEDNGVIDECLARCRFRKGETQGFHYLPLALKVLGVHLKRLGHSPRKWSNDLPTVRDFNRFRGDNPVFDIIRLNYDRLSVQLQELFMDVALFRPSNFWDDNHFMWLSLVHRQKLQDTQSQLQELKERGLVEDVDIDSGRVSMHDLYKEFAEMEAEGKLSSSAGFETRRWVYCRGSYPSDLERTPSGRCWENLVRVGMVFINEDPGGAFNLHGIQLRYCSNLVVLKLEVVVKPTGVLNLEGLRCLTSLELDGLEGSVVEGVENLTNLRCFRWYFPWDGRSEIEFDGSSYLGQLPASLEILGLHGAGVCLRSDVFDRCSNLRQLSLWHLGASDSMDLRQCSSLRSAYLEDVQGLQELLGLAAGLQSCLQSLEILGCEDLSDVSGLGDLVRLDRLVAHDNPLLEELPDLQRLTSLEFLGIGNCSGFTRFCIAEVLGLGGLGLLRELYCSGLDGMELVSLSALNRLHKLLLENCKELTTVEGFAGLTALQELILTGCKKLTALEGVACLTALRRVSLLGCRSLLRLPDLSNSTKLEELELSYSGIELHEEDIDMLAALPGLRRVELGMFIHLDLVRRKVVKKIYVDGTFVAVETILVMLPIKVTNL